MKVSVVIPTHNRTAWLELTIRSVLRQHHSDLETIVVDDGSTDDTPELLSRMADPRVRVIRHDSSQGVAASRNHGAAEARGEWIGFVDDDDVWAPDKLASQLDAVDAAGRTWVYAGVVHVDDHTRLIGGRPPLPPDAVARLVRHYNVVPGGGSNVIVQRDAFQRAGPFDVRLKNTEDWEMWIRLNEQGPPAWVPRPLVGKREHARMASLDVTAIFEGVSLIERRHETNVDRGVLHRWIAEVSLRNGQRLEAIKHMAIAAVRGQAPGVSRDAATIIRRRLHLDRPPTATPAAHAEWAEEARAWVDELLRTSATGADGGGPR